MAGRAFCVEAIRHGHLSTLHLWWFKHLPKAPGRTNGVANNWWRYVIDVNDPELDEAGP